MDNPKTLLNDIDKIKGQVEAAMHHLRKGDMIDTQGMEDSIRNVCDRAKKFPAAQHAEVKNALLALLSDMDGFYQLLQEKHAELSAQLKSLQPQKKALDAYSKGSQTKPDGE